MRPCDWALCKKIERERYQRSFVDPKQLEKETGVVHPQPTKKRKRSKEKNSDNTKIKREGWGYRPEGGQGKKIRLHVGASFSGQVKAREGKKA